MKRPSYTSYEATSVTADRSQFLIKKLLIDNGATGLVFLWQPPMEGMEFLIPIDGKPYRIRIRAIVNDKTRDHEQEVRRIWRVFYYQLKATFDSSKSGVMEFRELMLPYIVASDGQTVAEHIIPRLHAGLSANPGKLLPEPKE